MNAAECLDIDIHDIRIHPVEDEYVPVTIVTARGEIQARYYPVARAEEAVVCAGGDWDSPGAGQIYPRLCRDMQVAGIAALHVCCRQPAFQEEAVLDVLAGLQILAREGMRRFAIVGHAGMGPVASLAAARAPGARALITLGRQAHDLDEVADALHLEVRRWLLTTLERPDHTSPG